MPEPLTPGLTKADLAALRTCDDVVFATTNTGSQIRCIVRIGSYGHDNFRLTEGWKIKSDILQQVEYEIEVAGRFEEYAEPKGRDQGFAMVNASQFNEVWTGIKLHLKEGDSLCLNWVADNNNGYIKDAGLHSDALELWVRRPRKDGHITPFAFNVVNQLCPDNSARMVRFGAWNAAKPVVEAY